MPMFCTYSFAATSGTGLRQCRETETEIRMETEIKIGIAIEIETAMDI